MIIVDVETSGTEPTKHGILSIGAIDFAHPERQFYDECRIWEGAHIMDEALAVNGFTEKEAKDQSKKSEEEVIKAFVAWGTDTEDHTIAGHNPSFDRDFIKMACERHRMDWPFTQRTIDTHSVCYTHMVLNGIKPPLEKGRSALNLDTVLKYVGLPPEPKPHNALRGAIRATEVLSRILYGKTFFDEFKDFAIPDILKVKK